MAFPEERDRILQQATFRTLKFADRLMDWLGRANAQRRAAGQPLISTDEQFQLAGYRRSAASLYRSSLVPVATAVYGPSQSGKSLFMGRVIEPQDSEYSPLGPDEGRGAPVYYSQLSFDNDINPQCGAKEATAIVTRFTTKDRFERTAHRNYPVMARGLSRSEWLRVLARGYHSEVEFEKKESFRDKELSDLFEAIYEQSRGNEVDREWRMDLLDTYTYIQQSQSLRFHSDESYFNGLLGSYPLSQGGYVELAARLFWGNESALTALFHRICALLEKIRANGKDGILLHWAAIRFLLDSQQRMDYESPESKLFPRVRWNDIVDRVVDGWYVLDYDPGKGPPRDDLETIQSALLEMIIPVLPHRLNPLWRNVVENIDFLDIPGLINESKTSDKAESRETQNSIVKRGKVFYLFSRYIEELQAQTLLMLISGENLNVKHELSEYLKAWGIARYGKGVWPRGVKVDASPPALFLGMTGIDKEFVNNQAPTAALYDARLKEIFEMTFQHPDALKDFGGAGQVFTNVYPLRYPGKWDFDSERRRKAIVGGAVSADHWQSAGEAFVKSSYVQRYVADPGRKWDAAMRDGDGGTSLLAPAFQQVTLSENKRGELRRSHLENQAEIFHLAHSWWKNPDLNRDREQRVAVARDVLLWIESKPEFAHRRIRALKNCLCFQGGDVLPIANFADSPSALENPQSIEKRFPSTLREYLRNWGTVSAPGRWKDHTETYRDDGDWLHGDVFCNLAYYLSQFLLSASVFDRLCDRLMDVVDLKVGNREDRRRARQKFVRVILNDYVINPGDHLLLIDESASTDDESHMASFGLMSSFIRRWRVRLPAALSAGAGNKSDIPAGNDELLDELNRYESENRGATGSVVDDGDNLNKT